MRKMPVRNVIIFVVLFILGIISFKYSSENKDLMEVFLITQIPVFLGAFFLDIPLAVLLGLSIPLASSCILNYPDIFPDGVILSIEYLAFGFIGSSLNGRCKLNVPISLLLSMILGRIVSGIVAFILVATFQISLDPIKYVEVGVLNALPGIIIQIVLVPLIMYIFNHYTTINLE